MGLLSLGLSFLAMAWNYAYNIIFDHSLLKLGRPLYPRSFKLRLLHAILFELGLLLATTPIFMYVFGLSLWQALLTELGFTVTVPIIAVIFNYFYDWVFPPPT